MVLVNEAKEVITSQTSDDVQPRRFTREAVKLSSSALFELPDVPCQEQCEGFAASCEALAVGEPSSKRCLIKEGLGASSAPEHVADLAKDQLFGLVIEDTGSLSGALPESLTRLSPDLDGDGAGEQVVELLSLRPERATDSARRRLGAFGRLVINWEQAQVDAARRKVETYFGAWAFAGNQASLRPLVKDVWTTSDNDARVGISKLSAARPEKAHAAVFESTALILSDVTGFADPRFADHEKTLVLFVDGPDELRLKEQTAQTVIDAANATNTRIFVVHLDPELKLETSSGAPLIVDDPTYVREQDGCADDSACKSFEECRQIMRFSSSPGQNVSTPSEDRAALNFCLPKRDERGRIGPVDDYAQIACATGGGYLYVNNVERLAQQLELLPFVMDGLWEFGISSEALSRGTVKTKHPYLLQTTLELSLGDVVKTNVYSQVGDEGSFDNRIVLFAK